VSVWRRFQRLTNVPRQRYSDEIILFADSAGALKTVDEDGVVAAVGGGGGSVPFVGVDPPDDPTDGMLWWDPDDDTPVDGFSSSVQLVIGFADIAAVWDDVAQAAFVPVYTPSDGDQIQTVRVISVSAAFSSSFSCSAATEGDGSTPTVGDSLGGQTWDLSVSDTPGTGLTYVAVTGADPAVADAGRYWPVLIADASLSGAVGLRVVNFEPESPDPPDAGTVTIEVLVRAAA